MTGPRRRASDHVHEDYWEVREQHRYEDKIANEIGGMRRDLKVLSDRVLLLMGGVAILAFAIPILAPFIRSLVGIP